MRTRWIIPFLIISVSHAGTWVISTAKGAGTTAAGATFYAAVATGSGLGTGVTTEANVELQFQEAGTFSSIAVEISANNATAAGTVGLRKGTGAYPVTMADASEVITVNAGDVGFITETTHGSAHTDHVNTGDWVNFKLTNGTGGTIIYRSIEIWFTPDDASHTLTRLGAVANISYTSASTYFSALGTFQNTAARAEASTQAKFRTGGTLQNLCLDVTTNSVTSAVVRTRVGGSNGNQSVTLSSGTTGNQCLTGTADTLSDGSLVGMEVVTSGSGTFTIAAFSADFITTDNTAMLIMQGVGTNTVAASSTVYNHPHAGLLNNATEGLARLLITQNVTLDRMSVYIAASSLTGNAVFDFFKNNTTGSALTKTVASGDAKPAWFDDNTHSDAYVATDTLEDRVVTAAGGTSIEFHAQVARATVPATPTSSHIRHSVIGEF